MNMWRSIADFVLRFRIGLTLLLLAATVFMGYEASKVELSYEFTKAIPTDNPKYQDYQAFRKQFGEDGNLMVVGLQSKEFFSQAFFTDYAALVDSISKSQGVMAVLAVPTAVTIVKDTAGGQLKAGKVFDRHRPDTALAALAPAWPDLPASVETFRSLPFYRNFLYNPETNTYLAAISIDKDVMASKRRTAVVGGITRLGDAFGKAHGVEMHYSGLPLIRTIMATKVQKELRMFILLSFLLTAVILALFFRSYVAVLASMLVVAIGVIWSLGTIQLLGYKLSLLTGLIPPLIVVIGIPNCVYFLNKYHSEWARTGDKRASLVAMVERMGIVTLFTNLTAGIGFGVFAFTKSAILKEFGLVAGINILALFFISLILLPALFYFLPAPRRGHTNYMESGWITRLLSSLTNWTLNHRPAIYIITLIACIGGALGMMRLHAVGYIVDDLPKGDKVYQDMKFFERDFRGVMPLEIVIDAKKKYLATTPTTLLKIDSLHEYMKGFSAIGHSLAITEGIKFAYQAEMAGDSASYVMPSVGLNSVGTLLRRHNTEGNSDAGNPVQKLLTSFIDSTGQKTRISVSMADVGSVRLPKLIDSIRQESGRLFDSSKYNITYTGTSITFLEGSRFIIHSLRDSLVLAFIMIFACMIVLFRSARIVFISIVVNLVPLLITAGIMGWLGIPLKPSTVLVFSVALGITVDVTIRFLVSYKHDSEAHPDEDTAATVRRTIHDTGLSIIYTSLILIAGFGVFILSQFDGTKSLGFLTSLTLLVAMLVNLTLQPALLMWLRKKKAGDAKDAR